MSFFHYSQNNSGGGWKGPAQHVIIEAEDCDEADSIAEQHGLYFNGCESGEDCGCCGDRWSRAWSGDPEPTYYGDVVDESTKYEDVNKWPRCSFEDGPWLLIVRKEAK
jgi:hypothetical protein